jgi:heme/copper-type cytochrome/quinol oxidase subunit 3
MTRSEPLVPNAVLGVLIFIMTEAMLFAGLVSAFVIAESAAPGGMWPPPDQPRLPVGETAINTVALLSSGLALLVANRRFSASPRKATLPMGIGLALGLFFLVFQGVEWVALIGEGLTMVTSNHGAFFYLIVGMHGLHVLGGLSALGGLFFRLRRGELEKESLWAGSIFWYFVVGVWPIIYWQVYL